MNHPRYQRLPRRSLGEGGSSAVKASAAAEPHQARSDTP